MDVKKYMLAVAVALAAVCGGFAADWTVADGKMSDGVWTFEASSGGGNVTVGKCVAAPEKPTALDFSKGVSANGASVKIVSLDPRFIRSGWARFRIVSDSNLRGTDSPPH